MKVISEAMNGGTIPDRYGKRGSEVNAFGVPSRSVTFRVEDAPEGTVSYALFLEDRDAVPVCGFSWVHWIAADITRDELGENESAEARDFVQGINSWYGDYGEDGSMGYGGMAPPDRPHRYELHVFALDKKLNMKNGFFLNELFQAMEGHILDRATVTGVYAS